MNKLVNVHPWNKATDAKEYDALIAAVGYESRANYIASLYKDKAHKLFACAFDQRQVLHFEENIQWYSQNGFEVEECDDNAFRVWCERILDGVCSGCLEASVCVDISSMSRFRIATLVAAALARMEHTVLDIDFLYSLAEFSPPQPEDVPIIISRPVIDFFAGWSDSPEKPAVTVFGLGYEEDKAIGVMEYLEPAEVWAFRPRGEDQRFDTEVLRANKNFLEALPRRNTFIYDVKQPFECYRALESLTYGTFRVARPILVPFGPKIFTLCCLLVACVHYPKVAVWRVSSGQFEQAVDRIPSRTVVGLKAVFHSTKGGA